MKFNRLGFVLAGSIAFGLVGCPAPSEKDDDDETEVDAATSESKKDGGAGSTVKKDTGTSGEAGKGGSAGSAAGSSGSGGGGSGGAGSGGSGGGGSSGSSGGQDAGTKDAGTSMDAGSNVDSGAGNKFASVYSIFNTNCAKSGCHSNAFATESGAKTFLEGLTTCATATEKKRVVPNKAADSYVIKKLEKAAGICGDQMPKGGTPVGSGDIDKIKAWINAGANW